MKTKTTNEHEVYAKNFLAEQIKIIKAAHPASSLAKANPHILKLASDADTSGWAAGGNLEFAAAIIYTLECNLALTNFQGVAAVKFSSDGIGPAAALIVSAVAGFFVVDPATLPSTCTFGLGTLSSGAGVVTLTLVDSDGGLYGTFAGPAGGTGIAGIKGTGDLKVTV